VDTTQSEPKSQERVSWKEFPALVISMLPVASWPLSTDLDR